MELPGVVGEGPSPLQLLLTVKVSSRGVGIGHPRSVSWDRSGTTLALGTVGNAVCLVQPGEVSSLARTQNSATDVRLLVARTGRGLSRSVLQ